MQESLTGDIEISLPQPSIQGLPPLEYRLHEQDIDDIDETQKPEAPSACISANEADKSGMHADSGHAAFMEGALL